MGTLNLIRNRINKAERLREAQLHHTAYRGVTTSQSWQKRDVHGEFTYRGVPYTK